MKQTALTSIDSYKLAHLSMWPEGTEFDYANFTPRSMVHLNVPREYKDGLIVWFGLQAFLIEMHEIWNTTFFWLPKDEVIPQFEKLVAPFCGDQGLNWKPLEELHDLGYLPLLIKALPEATLVPIGVPVLTIENTVPGFFWLPAFMETWLSCELWKASTSATTARVFKKIITKYSNRSGANKDFTAIQAHDFSVRGMSGYADAAKSGAGHLLSFVGTDNIPAVQFVNDYYRGQETFVGCSVPASEHGVMAAGTKDSELETYRRMLKLYPTGIISLVSDTYDFFNVITNFAVQLKDEIMARKPDSMGFNKVVFRPDSGDPVKIIAGWDCDTIDEVWSGSEGVIFEGRYYEVLPSNNNRSGWVRGRELSYHEVQGAVVCLWEIFGGTLNEIGYKTLDQHVGLIYGDSITPERCEQILSRLNAKGFASDNVVFGVGSYTYQYTTRDSLGFAMKSTYIEGKDGGVAIFKDPITDKGTKKSARGLLRVEWENGKYILKENVSREEADGGCLQPVFKDGTVLINSSFEELRARLVASEEENQKLWER